MSGELDKNLRNGMRGKFKPSPFLWNLHGKEALVTHVIPGFLGEVLCSRNVMVVEKGTEFINLNIKEGLFFGRKLRFVRLNELLKRRTPAKDVSVEACRESSAILPTSLNNP